MKIDDDSIDRLSELAKLRPDEKEREALKSDLSRILGFIDKLDELDCEGVAPLKHVLEEGGNPRPDEVRDEVDQDEALRNAPDRDSDYIKVPKFIRRQEGE